MTAVITRNQQPSAMTPAISDMSGGSAAGPDSADQAEGGYAREGEPDGGQAGGDDDEVEDVPRILRRGVRGGVRGRSPTWIWKTGTLKKGQRKWEKILTRSSAAKANVKNISRVGKMVW